MDQQYPNIDGILVHSRRNYPLIHIMYLNGEKKVKMGYIVYDSILGY